MAAIEDGQRKVQIPSIGDKLILDKPWTFNLWNEYRNETLLALFGKDTSGLYGKAMTAHRVTLAAGTELRVDRIYIRKGVKAYDSVTFLAKGLRKTKTKLPKVPPQPEMEHNLGPRPDVTYAAHTWDSPATKAAIKKRDAWQDAYSKLWEKHRQTQAYKDWEAAYRAHDKAKRLSRPVRFWAKLVDVNKMVVRSAEWTAREHAEPVLGQRAIALD